MRAAFLVLLLAAVPALAQQQTPFGGLKADTKAPVEVTSDHLGVSQADGAATFEGNVVIAQGPMRLGADKVVVVYAKGDRSRIASLTATGHVTLASNGDAAEAREATYDVEGGTVTLSGDVLMTQGKNVLSGERLVVDLGAGTARVEGRVRSVIQPAGQ